jgi:hypothetical protein
MDDARHVSRRLIENFRETFNEQIQRALARRIHAKVRDARSDPDLAARRWSFELIQNAHDAGARDGRDGISLAFELTAGTLRFEHDAAPFSMADIAALLTGGSSKDFDSQETTGRFGTGFLVTHVLSERVQVAGVLDVDGKHRAFKVRLDRPDDEDRILRNMKDAESALGKTRVVTDFPCKPTATVEYVVDDNDTVLAGLAILEQALPHLFGTCRRLREIRIRHADREIYWKASGLSEPFHRDGIWIEEVAVSSADSEGKETNWRLIRATMSKTASGRLVLALRRDGDAWIACKPGKVPSVFRQLPLLGGPMLPIWVIIDGEFDVDQERSSVHVVGEHGRPLREALAALGGLALMAIREQWGRGYRVAQLAMPWRSWRECEAGLARGSVVYGYKLG